MSDKNFKEILIEKYNAFSLEENQEKMILLRDEIESILKKIEDPDSHDFHIWGLIHYNSDLKIHLDIALEKFQNAYLLDSNNFLACLYIAHCFHDKRNLETALEFYKKVDQQKLKAFQFWRYVKLIEQIGFCHFKLGREQIGKEKFKEVLFFYKNQKEENSLAAPIELIECFEPNDTIVKEIKKIEDYLK